MCHCLFRGAGVKLMKMDGEDVGVAAVEGEAAENEAERRVVGEGVERAEEAEEGSAENEREQRRQQPGELIERVSVTYDEVMDTLKDLYALGDERRAYTATQVARRLRWRMEKYRKYTVVQLRPTVIRWLQTAVRVARDARNAISFDRYQPIVADDLF